MTRLVVAIEHHPKRAEQVKPLLAALPDAVLVTDPNPGSALTNSYRTFRECLRKAPKHGHLLILQDDAEPCERLLDAVELIRHSHYVRDLLVVLWHGAQPSRGAMTYKAAQHKGERYVVIKPSPWVPLIATLWPAVLAHRMLAWDQATNPVKRMRSDDAVVSKFMTHTRTPIVATIPSLVEHPDLDSIRKKPRGRVALNYIGGRDPLALDWERVPVLPSASLSRARLQAMGQERKGTVAARILAERRLQIPALAED